MAIFSLHLSGISSMLGAMNFRLNKCLLLIMISLYVALVAGCLHALLLKTYKVVKSKVTGKPQERSYSTGRSPKPPKWGPEDETKELFEIAYAFMRTGQKATAAIINQLLGCSVTDEELQALINGPRLSFTDLTLRKDIITAIRALGKSSGTLCGVYIFTHTPTGKKYAGSSSHLPTRLNSYFTINANRVSGKLLPLLLTCPITEFTLELTPGPSLHRNEMILEQYYLLDPSFNLNTIRVSNNPSGSTARPLYLYNADSTVLYYSSNKQIDFIRVLGINFTTFTKHLDTDTLYLGSFVFSRVLDDSAVDANMSIQ